MSQIETYQIKYAKFCSGIRNKNFQEQEESKGILSNFETEHDMLNFGFAIKLRKKGQFNEQQVEYLVNLFEEGEKDSSKKARPSAVEADMISKFSENLCLNERQILSYFSKLSANKKKGIEPKQQLEKFKKRKKKQSTRTKKRKSSIEDINPNDSDKEENSE